MQTLEHIIKAFDPTLPVDEAKTAPASWYADKNFSAFEEAAVFRRQWIPVGRAEQVEKPGQFFSGEVAGEPFGVVRGEDQILRAFSNVCRHHAAGVMPACGQAKELVCPYHGWRYGLDGRLLKAPHMGPIKHFDRKLFGLKELRVSQWRELVFIHWGKPVDTPGERLQELDKRLKEMTPEPLHFVEERIYDLECDWKVFCDNYLDGGYHVGVLHPDLSEQLELGTYRTELFEHYSIQSTGAHERSEERVGKGALYAFVYPNLMLNRYGPILDTNIAFPLGPGRCRIVFNFYFIGERAKDEDFVRESLIKSEQVQAEDTFICHSVQKGLGSCAYDTGRYAPLLEHAMHQFHVLLAQDLSTKLADDVLADV
jgi:choline monooxygenase